MSPPLTWVRMRRFWALPVSRQTLVLESALALLKATWQVRTWPFQRLAASLGTASSPAPSAHSANTVAPTAGPKHPADVTPALDVRWAISAWVKAWPRAPTCLIQAVAARHLLGARQLPCQLYFGVRSPKAGADHSSPALGAHAWLVCADAIVTGDAEAANFQPIAVYRFDPAAVVATH